MMVERQEGRESEILLQKRLEALPKLWPVMRGIECESAFSSSSSSSSKSHDKKLQRTRIFAEIRGPP
jgi:hypothetical protein